MGLAWYSWSCVAPVIIPFTKSLEQGIVLDAMKLSKVIYKTKIKTRIQLEYKYDIRKTCAREGCS